MSLPDPIAVPTLAEVFGRVQDDLNARLPGADSRLRRSTVWALAAVVAGASHLSLGFLVNASREVFPDLAGAAGVDRWRRLWGLPAVEPAAATGTVTITGTNGTTIPTGAVIVRADGVEYTVDTGGTIAGGSVDLAITASETGTDGNADAGVILSLATPITGADSEGSSAAGLSGGVDPEGVEAMRARVLSRMADPLTGGSPADFVAWVRETGGIREVWISPNAPTPGQCEIRFTVEGSDPIPSAAKVAAVQEYIAGTAGASPFPYADARAPIPLVGDRVDVREISGQSVDYHLTTLEPDNADTRAGVLDALDDLHLRTGEPGGVLRLSQIYGAIDAVPGESYHVLAAPAADVTIGADAIPVRGVVTWPDGSTTP